MFKKIDRFSFGVGLIVPVFVACAIGATANLKESTRRYEASPVLSGTGIQIVDHQTNMLYNYRRDRERAAATYWLYETVDLSQTGKNEIRSKIIVTR